MKNSVVCFFSILPFIFVFNSCSQQKAKTSKSEMDDNSPKILFLNFEISKTKDDKIEFRLIDKVAVEGKIKKNDIAINEPKVGDFKCVELDERKNPIRSFYFSNPLNKRVEYVDDDKQLATKNVELETTMLSIRMQLHQQTKLIAMEQINDKTKKTDHITTIKLN